MKWNTWNSTKLILLFVLSLCLHFLGFVWFILFVYNLLANTKTYIRFECDILWQVETDIGLIRVEVSGLGMETEEESLRTALKIAGSGKEEGTKPFITDTQTL